MNKFLQHYRYYYLLYTCVHIDYRILNITFPEIFYSIMVTSMVAPMIAAYGLNGCLQTDIYNYHNFFLVLDKYVS